MRRKLAARLAVALLILVLAPIASADFITTPGGTLLIPDGSQITSVFIDPNLPGCGFNVVGLNFQFQGGTGSTIGCFNDGETTNINFRVSVTDLFLTALTGEDAAIFTDSGPVFQCSPAPSDNHCPAGGMLNLTLDGPISSLLWESRQAPTGFLSLTFTAADDGDLPTSSLVLLGFGLMGLLVSFRHKITLPPPPFRSRLIQLD
jgi:hypothetical protein